MSCVSMKKAPEIMFRENGGPLRKIYNVTKTLTDCFKFRNKSGMDIVLRYSIQIKQGGSHDNDIGKG